MSFSVLLFSPRPPTHQKEWQLATKHPICIQGEQWLLATPFKVALSGLLWQLAQILGVCSQCSGFISVTVITHPGPKQPRCEEEVYFSFQLEVTVHPCGQVKEGTSDRCSNSIHSQEQRKVKTHTMLFLCCAQLLFSSLIQFSARPRECCHLQWLDIPTPMNLIKINAHGHVHRPTQCSQPSVRPSS